MILQHWRPLSIKGDYFDEGDDGDNNVEDEDKNLQVFERASDFAKPVQRRKKKDLDLRKWKEITQGDSSSLGKESKEDVSSCNQTTEKMKNDKGNKTADKETSSSSDDVSSSMEVDAKPQLDSLNGGFVNSTTTMEIDTSNKVDHQEKINYPIIYDDKEENVSVPGMDPIFSSSTNIRSEQKPVSLESEIDVENRARIQHMSAEEIAEAQAELMEKMNPALLKVLQKRGQEKLKKRSSSKSEVGTGTESVNQHVESAQDAKRLHTADDIFHTVMTSPSKEKLDDEKNSTKTSTTSRSSLWNAWSNRVEAVRELRFSLAGDVVESEWVSAYGMIIIILMFFTIF